MSLEEVRRKSQLLLLEQNSDIQCGSLSRVGLSLEQLKSTSPHSPWVIDYFPVGLTNHIFHIRDEDKGGAEYTLKLRRSPILVANADGKTSFLNEVQRRTEIEKLRQQEPWKWQGVVETIFASHQDGIILSNWIEGREIEFNEDEIWSLFSVLIIFVANGFFEWDLSSGNYRWSHSGIRLFDFGYMYRFDPKIHFNSNGIETPLFHFVERFETRCFFPQILHVEEREGIEAAIELFRLEKKVAVAAYRKMKSELVALNAAQHVVDYYASFIEKWESALESSQKLRSLYDLESFRSWKLDVDDDIGGKSCTAETVVKVQKLQKLVKNGFDFLQKNDGLFFGDEDLSQQQLLSKYQEAEQEVRALILDPQ